MSTTPAPTVKAWAIKDERGKILACYIRATRSEAIDSFMPWVCLDSWKECYRIGYRAVRVIITEITK